MQNKTKLSHKKIFIDPLKQHILNKRLVFSYDMEFADFIYCDGVFDESMLFAFQEDKLFEQNPKKAVDLYKKMLENGDMDAKNNLGYCFYFGKHIEENKEQALKLFQEAATLGSSNAKINIANCYLEGNVLQKNEEQAFYYFLDASKNNDPIALFNLGQCYRFCKGVELDLEKAFLCYFVAELFCKDSHIKSIIQNNLGCCYFFGHGIERNYKKAFDLFSVSSQAGNVFAKNNLACCYLEAYGTEIDYEKAFYCLREAASKNCKEAFFNFGQCYLNSIFEEENNREEAKEFFLLAKEEKCPYADFMLYRNFSKEKTKESIEYQNNAYKNLSVLAHLKIPIAQVYNAILLFESPSLAHGKKRVKSNMTLMEKLEEIEEKVRKKAVKINQIDNATSKAFDIMKEATKYSDTALYNIGVCYHEGLGIEKNIEKAFEYFEKAGLQRNAQNILGVACIKELNGEKNFEKAVKYFEKASEQYYCAAQNNLANCYHAGYGVERDFERAYNFYDLAKIEDKNAMYSFGYYTLYGIGCEKNVSKGLQILQESANDGNENALTEIGKCYFIGDLVEKDYNKAIENFNKAISSPEAKTYLGTCYLCNYGDSCSYEKAAKLYAEATQEDFTDAYFCYGYCYYYGYGVQKNPEIAFNNFIVAANYGNQNAMHAVGICFLYGVGTEKDLKKAMDWFLKAEKYGNQNSISEIKRLMKNSYKKH